ncbi:MAG: hypothetical protein PVF49_07585 [Anaerolineales bacterium]
MRFSNRKYLLILGVMLLASLACARTIVPVGSRPTTTPTPPLVLTQTIAQATYIPGPGSLYAIVRVPPGETLPVRRPAGIAGTIVEELPYDQHGIRLTGNTTRLGSSTWVEIRALGGITGWVNSINLTEDVTPESFCSDPRVLDLLEQLGNAIGQQNDQLLQEIVYPVRGLTVRHDWWNPEIVLTTNDLRGIFQDPSEREWGERVGTGSVIRGSFSDVILPLLLDVVTGSPSVVCNQLETGVTGRSPEWPAEYVNINFYSLYDPAAEASNEFDWSSWAVGIEFYNGDPYVSLLVHYEGDL